MSQGAILLSGMHISDLGPQFWAGKHRHVNQSKWLKDVLLQIIIEGQPGDSFHGETSPVNADLCGP